MKNLKIRTKLILGFSCVAVMAVIVGLTGIIGLRSTATAYSDFNSGALEGVSALSDLRELFTQQRLILRGIALDIEDTEAVLAGIDSLSANETAMQDAMGIYEGAVLDLGADTDYYEFKDAYFSIYASIKEQFTKAVESGDYNAVAKILSDGGQAAVSISSSLKGVISHVNRANLEQAAAVSKQVTFINGIQIIVVVMAAVLAVALGLYISSIISTPLGYMAHALTQIGTKGELELDAETAQSAQSEVHRKDEIGICARAAVCLIEHLTYVSETLNQIAKGDLTVQVSVLSERDMIGSSVALVLENLNGMFSEINSSSMQVSSGTRQIANGSQSLAQGTAEQAAAVEELSCSISEISAKTQGNVDMAVRASELADSIKHGAEKGNLQMEQMLEAVKEIQDASQSISKVIKVIDDIAFQTNILALNAAVEAARAGSHGKGFAVVAEEVRSLAAKSSGAAKDTGELIANSMQRAEFGAQIAGETAESLADIVTGINENRSIVNEITQSFEEQAAAISQINKGIDQVAHVIQQNSATAQESAAASEEMSEQSDNLKEMVSRFKLKGKKSISGM